MEKDTLYEEQAVAIGRLSIAFNQLEQYLLVAIGILLGEPRLGTVVGGELNYAPRLALMCKLIEHRNIDTTNLSDFLVRLKKIAQERNRYIHSEYRIVLGYDEEFEGVEIKDNRRKRQTETSVAFTLSDPADILAAAREARALADAFPFALATLQQHQ